MTATRTAPTTLYRGGRVRTPCHPHATALLVAGEAVAWVGPDADAPTADRTVPLDGALVTPAFVDAHVHLTDTGLTAGALDLSEAGSAGELLAAVARAAAGLPADAVVFGHGWDESRWADPTLPDAAALDRAAGNRPVYAAQASLHSALCSSALLSAAAGAAGYDPGGWLRRDAHHAARTVALGAITAAQREAAQRAALRRAASLGIAAVHECGGPGIASAADFSSLLARSGDGGPEVYGFWGELGGAETARRLGAVAAGGDLFADGALGSGTAHLREPYLDRPGGDWPLASPEHGSAGGSVAGTGVGSGTVGSAAGPATEASAAGGQLGNAYLTSEQVRDHLLDCHAAGLAGGFHAIGDAALATVLAGFAAAAARLGVERLRAARHRIEHAELLDRAMIAKLVEYGIIASVQPAFDRLWGGPAQMYAQRLGPGRALAANPLGAMHSVGVSLAFGSDSPVTPLDPWGAVRAAAWHHNPAQRISAGAGFAAHTRGGWRAVHQDQHGVLAPGAPATFAVWQTPAGVDGTLPVLLAEAPEQRGPHDPTPLPRCRATVLRGRTIFDEEHD
jgi:hypothetical protein